MTKRIVLTAFIALTATFVVLAQTDSQTRPGTETTPAKKIEHVDRAGTTQGTAKVQHTGKRPDGTTYKGGNKDGKKDWKQDGAKGTRTNGTDQAKGQSTAKPKHHEGTDGKPEAGEKEGHEGHPHADDQNPDAAAHKQHRAENTAKSGQTDHKTGNRPTTVKAKEKENDH